MHIDQRMIEGTLALFLLDLPAFGGADGAVSGGFTLQQKGGAVRELSDGRVDAEIPDCRGDEVFTRLEQRGEIKALIAPVGQVAAGWAVACTMAVYIQNEAVVGANANRIGGRNRCQRERAAEVEHHRLAQRGGGMRDPGGLPLAVGWVGLEIGLGVEGEGGKEESE